MESILTRQPDPVEALLDEARGDDLLIMGLPTLETAGTIYLRQKAQSPCVSRMIKGPPMLLLLRLRRL